MKKLLDPRWFRPLKAEDIEGKIKLNLEQHKIDLPELRRRLEAELFQNRRSALYLRIKHWRKGIFRFLDRNYEETKLTFDIQAQNLTEQIAYIDRKIKLG